MNGPAAVDIDHGEAPAATTLEDEPLADADLAQPVIEIQEVGHMQYSEVWNPPDAGEGFWQVVDPEDGYPETGGTRYILAHACENRECAGDRLIDLETGDTLDILGEHYRVDENYIAHKDAIGDQPIWEHVPGRVVLVTCVITEFWWDSVENEIIVATPVGP